MRANGTPESDGSGPAVAPRVGASRAVGRRAARARWAGPALVVAAILLANASYLLGFTDPNPLGPRSGLVVESTPGPVAGDRTIDPNNGMITQAVGHEVARQVFAGDIPLWNHYEGVGAPLLASGQAAAAFPPTWLNRWQNGLFLETLLLEVVAGLSTLYLVRRLRLHEAAAVAAGIAYGLNGTFAWLQNGAMLPVAFLPLLLIGVERAHGRAAAEQPAARRGGWVTLAAALALAIFSGFVETVYLYGLLVAAWALWRLARLGPGARLRFARKLAAGVGAGTLVGALMLGPFVAYLGSGYLGGHEGVFSNLTLPVEAWPTVLGLPYALGGIFAISTSEIMAVWANVGGFLSAGVVALAILGVTGRRDRGLRLVLIGWVAFCLAKSFGPGWFLRLVNVVPGMNSVAFYRYMSPALSLAVVVLAAFAVDDVVRRDATRRTVLATAATMAALLAVAVVCVRGPMAEVATVGKYVAVSVVWAAGTVAAIAVLATFARGRVLAVALCGVVAADVVAMFAVPTLSAPRHQVIDTASVAYLEEHLGLQRYFTYGPIGVNYGSWYGIGSALMTDVPMPGRLAQWVHDELGQDIDPINLPNLDHGLARFSADPDAMRFLGVSHVVTRAGSDVPEPLRSELTLVHRDGAADVYELADPAPYFDIGGAPCRVAPEGRDRVVVECAEPAQLVRREVYFPDWRATVDGRSTAIEPADGLFQAIDVPAGRTVVRYSYAPPYWTLTVAVSLAGVLWIVAALLTRRWRSRRESAAPGAL